MGKIYIRQGEKYDIPEDKVEAFTRRYPTAVAVDDVDFPFKNLMLGKETASEEVEQVAVGNPMQPTQGLNKALASARVSLAYNSPLGNTDAMIRQSKQIADSATRTAAVTGTVQRDVQYNPVSNQFEQMYVTPNGAITPNKALADYETNQFREYRRATDMSLGGQLQRAEDELRELQEQYKKASQNTVRTTSARAFMPAGVRTHDEAVSADNNELNTLWTTIRQKQEQIQMLRNKISADNDADNLWGDTRRYFRHAGQAVFNTDAWDFGLGALGDATTMLKVAEKAQQGTPLTENEQNLLENIYLTQNIQSQYGDLGDAAQFGEMGGQWLSFMKDMALFNVAGGANIGANLTKNLIAGMAKKGTSSLAKRFASEGTMNFIRHNGLRGVRNLILEQGAGRAVSMATTRALGVAAEDLLIKAPVMTATIQAGNLAADIIETKLGPVQYDDNTGQFNFVNDTSWGEAAWEQSADRIIENASEMIGGRWDFFKGFGLDDVERIFGANHVVSRMLRATPETLSTAVNKTSDILSKFGFNGVPGEVAEEYWGQFARTMSGLESAYMPLYDDNGKPIFERDGEGKIVLDEEGNPVQAKQNLFESGEFHKDIWGGIALTAGMMQTASTGMVYGGMALNNAVNNAANKKMLNKALRMSDIRANALLTPEIWEPLREALSAMDNEDVIDMTDWIRHDNDFTDKQRDAAMSYIWNLLQQRGSNLMELAEKRNGVFTEYAEEWGNAYNNGYETVEAEQMQDIRNMYDYQRNRLSQLLTPEEIASIDADAANYLSVANIGNKKRDAVLDYVNAKQVYDGMQQRGTDDVDIAIEQSNALIDSHTHQDSNQVQSAIMKEGDRKVYVMKGNVITREDGTIDVSNSDDSIIVRDAETGEMIQMSPELLLQVDEVQDASEQKALAENEIRTRMDQEFNDKVNGTVYFNAGDVYNIVDDSGNPAQLTVTPNKEGVIDNGDGTVNVTSDGVNVVAMNKETIQEMVDAANIGRIANNEVERTTKLAAQTTQSQPTDVAEPQTAPEPLNVVAPTAPQMPTSFNFGDEITIVDDNGNPVTATIYLIDDDGYTIDLKKGTLGGRKAAVVKPDEIQDVLYNPNAPVTEVVEEQPQDVSEPMQPTAEEVPVAGGQNVAQPTEPAPITQVSAMQRVPKDGEGNLLYEQTDPQTAWDAIVEQTNGNAAMAQNVVDSMVADKEAALKKVEKIQLPKGISVAEKIVAEQEKANAISQAQNELAFWQSVSQLNNVAETVEEVQPTQEEAVEEQPTEVVEESQPIVEEQPAPVKEYEDRAVDDVWNELLQDNENDVVEAVDTAKQMYNVYKTEYDKVEKHKATGKTVQEINEAKRARKAKLADLQRRMDYWQKVAERGRDLVAEQKRIEEINEATKNFAKYYSQMGEPINFHDYVLRALSGGGIKFRWADSPTGTKGLGSHLGMRSEEERRKRIWLLNNESGLYPEQVAEDLIVGYESETNSRLNIDTMEALDEVLDILRTHSTAKSMYDEVLNIQDEINDRNQREERRRFDEWCYENFGMTAEEYEAYQEVVEAELRAKDFTDEEYEAYNNIVAEETLNQQTIEENEDTEGNEQGRNDELRTGSDEVLPSEESVSAGGIGETESNGGSEADVDSDSENGAVSESAQGEQVEETTKSEQVHKKVAEGTNGERISKLPKAERAKAQRAALEELGIFAEVALPKGSKWSDGRKFGQKATRRSASTQITALVVGEDLYIKGIGLPWTNINNKNNDVYVIRNFRKWQSIGDFQMALLDHADITLTPSEDDAINTIFTENGIGFNRSITRPIEFQQSAEALEHNTPAEQLATASAVAMLENNGIEVVEATDEMVEAVLGEREVQFMSVSEAKRRTDEINSLTPIEVASNNKTKEELKEIYNNLPNVNKNGNEIQFYHSAFKKIYKEGGLFAQVIPQLDEILRQSVLAYSEQDNLGGILRRDGSIHKVHPNVVSFDNFVGKVTIEGKEYYVRTTVKNQEGEAGTHSFFVTSVDIYEKSVNGLSVPNFPSGEIDHKRIIDAKLQQFFEYAKGNVENSPQFSQSSAVFYSNAKRAVLEIKQDKATPEQWIAMLKKNGGLKAGEDAWVGLEAWLNEQTGSVSKQSIIDYIDESSIQIEEVEYSERRSAEDIYYYNPQNNDFEFTSAMWNELEDRYGITLDDNFDYMPHEYLKFEGSIEERLALAEKVNNNAHLVNAENYYLDNLKDIQSFVSDVETELMHEIDDWSFGNGSFQNGDINPTRLHYTTEGLENKREIALVVPTIDSYREFDDIHFGDAGNGRAVAWVRFGETTAPIKEYEDFYAYQKRMQEKYYPNRKIQSLNEADLVQLTDEERAEFKRLQQIKEQIPLKDSRLRVLVIDEIQSKRHQDGREFGYRDDKTVQGYEEAKETYSKAVEAHTEFRNRMKEKYGDPMDVQGTAEERREARKAWKMQWSTEELATDDQLTDRMSDARRAYESYPRMSSLVPSAPFEKNWHELAMKRMMRYAAENGFGKIAWTTGKQQADRYDIGNVIRNIDYKVDTNGAYIIDAYGNNGYQIENIPSYFKSEEEISNVFGKELANKIVSDLKEQKEKIDSLRHKKTALREQMRGIDENSSEYENPLAEYSKVSKEIMEAQKPMSMEGEGLRIGGEGMKGFYDKMLPSFVNKYAKKWGAKVGEVTMPNLQEGYQTMHSVDVTPQMREDVMKGQPMFMRTPNGTVYGWTIGGKVYLTKSGMNPNTPVHEYTHLWANAMMQKNPKGWQSIKDLLRGTPVWNDVMLDNNYANIHDNEDLVASEVLSRLSGKENAKKLEAMAEEMLKESKGIFAKAEAISLIERMKEALNKFWNWVGTNLFGIDKFDSIEQVTDRVLWDMATGTDLSGVEYSDIVEAQIITDPKLIEQLESEPKIKVYRAMQLHDGKLYPPMAGKTADEAGGKRQWGKPIELGKWEQSEERPDLVIPDVYKKGKNKGKQKKDKQGELKWLFRLDKGNGTTVDAAYNPYLHTSKTPLNDQFSSAQSRPELVTVEVEVPQSELTSGYKAEKAKDSVGRIEWKAGPIQGKLSGKREVILSRYDKPIRIVPDNEVADEIIKMLEGKNIVFPSNVVTPSLRTELEKRGVQFVETNNQGEQLREEDDDVLYRINWSDKTAENAVLTFKEHFPNAGEVVIFNSPNELYDFGRRLGEPEEDINDYLKRVEDVEVAASYSPDLDKMLIFAWQHANFYQTLFHENVHRAINKLGGIENFMDLAIALKYFDIELFNKLFKYYSQDEINDEVITYSLEYAFAGNALESLKTVLSEKAIEQLNEILNYIGYETGRDTATEIERFERHPNSKEFEYVRGRTRRLSREFSEKNERRKLAEIYSSNTFQSKTERTLGEGSEAEGADRELEDLYRSSEEDQAYAERMRSYMRDKVNELAERLGVNIEIVEDASTLKGNKSKAKGFFNPRTGTITVVLPNNSSIADVESTVFHEAVAHYGLRQLFGDKFDKFLDEVYEFAEPEIRERIARMALRGGLDIRKATEEYLATLAEDTKFFESSPAQLEWFAKIKRAFIKMLRTVGLNYMVPRMSDNELRYFLWLSYENLRGKAMPIFKEAAQITKQQELGLDNYGQSVDKTDSVTDSEEVLYRKGETPREKYERVTRRPTINNDVKLYHNLWNRFVEAYQDKMQSLSALQNAVAEESGKPIKPHEDAYSAENRMSSENKAQAEIYKRDFFGPLMNVITNLVKNKKVTYQDIKDYLIAKHGLERNDHMAMRDAMQQALKDLGPKPERPTSYLDADYDAKQQAWEDWNVAYTEAVKTNYEANRQRDYAGLTGLTKSDNIADAEAKAEQIVVDFENKCGNQGIIDLWNVVNNATKATLRKQFESGLISKSTYENVQNMYEYYVPLRGWDAETAEDNYDYLLSSSVMLPPVFKTAKGRGSLADDPIATIGFMAEAAIIKGNRNLMKQRFLAMARNHETDLLTITEQWYTYDVSTDSWVPSFPQIPADATAEQIAQAITEHEERMEEAEKNGTATKNTQGLKLGMHILEKNAQEHCVRVLQNGKEYCIYVNGNPRAAQALNGLTNPNMNDGNTKRFVESLKNGMAQLLTSMNPAFIITNLSRDILWAGTSVMIKEGAKYVAQYTKNISKALTTASIPRLLKKFNDGTLDESIPEERMFAEFIRNGGETGFTQINTVENYKRDIKRMIKDSQSGPVNPRKAWNAVWNGVEFLNRSAEDTTRFMVYMTSRQMGRTVAESINDAKEITVNFNRKGSGGMGARLMSFAYIFFNAAVQSLANFGKLLKNHPVKTTAALLTFASAGLIAPTLNLAMQAMFGGDDDDTNYWDLPEWVRRNNIVLWFPFSDNGYLTIPLPHELRPFYGMGEIAMSIIYGKENIEDGLSKATQSFASLLPLDFTGNGGNLSVTLAPSVWQPIEQVRQNVDFFGVPIYKKNDWNETDPEYSKAYSGTSTWLIDATRWLNDFTREKGQEMSGDIDLNPAIIEHLFEAYTGGVGKTINRTAKTIGMIWDEDLREWRNVPVASSFYRTVDNKTVDSQVNREYFEAIDEMKETQATERYFKKQKEAGIFGYAEELKKLQESELYKRYLKIKKANKDVKKWQEKLKTANPQKAEDIENRILQIKVDMLEELERIENEDVRK